MIVGNGLIASAFISAGFDSSHHVIFASGISNSAETNPAAYQREFDLLKESLDPQKVIVYFSTTSIFDPTRQDSRYIIHKKEIENYIRDHIPSFLLVRLPIMIGPTSNPNTLINFLVNAIRSQTPIQLHTKACRHLLDVDDLVPLINPYLINTVARTEINIPGSEKINIPDLIYEIENILDARGLYSWVDTGACYSIPSDAGEIIYVKKENYISRTLQKYFGKQNQE